MREIYLHKLTFLASRFCRFFSSVFHVQKIQLPIKHYHWCVALFNFHCPTFQQLIVAFFHYFYTLANSATQPVRFSWRQRLAFNKLKSQQTSHRAEIKQENTKREKKEKLVLFWLWSKRADRRRENRKSSMLLDLARKKLLIKL